MLLKLFGHCIVYQKLYTDKEEGGMRLFGKHEIKIYTVTFTILQYLHDINNQALARNASKNAVIMPVFKRNTVVLGKSSSENVM